MVCTICVCVTLVAVITGSQGPKGGTGQSASLCKVWWSFHCHVQHNPFLSTTCNDIVPVMCDTAQDYRRPFQTSDVGFTFMCNHVKKSTLPRQCMVKVSVRWVTMYRTATILVQHQVKVWLLLATIAMGGEVRCRDTVMISNVSSQEVWRVGGVSVVSYVY